MRSTAGFDEDVLRKAGRKIEHAADNFYRALDEIQSAAEARLKEIDADDDSEHVQNQYDLTEMIVDLASELYSYGHRMNMKEDIFSVADSLSNVHKYRR